MSKKPPVLEIEAVTKTFAGPVPVHAVRGVSLALEASSFAALIGPSGSGKTTLLNLASSLDSPTTGEIRIEGECISKLTPARLTQFRRWNLGFIFQSYNLFPTLTAAENVEYTSIIRGDDRRVARARAKRSLEAVGLADKLHSFPNQLSGGQQQRVAVARALATEPKIIFADEPTANLDSQTAMELIDLFETLNRTRGVTFLFSTHDLRLVERVRNRFHLRDGVIERTE
jgi:putative ABC transport system ATP-binding protein